MLKEFRAGLMDVRVYETRAEMGAAAAADACACLKEIVREKGFANAIFAAAPSQNEFLAALCASDAPLHRVNALHMDEYVGLPADAPAGFGNFLRRAIFDKAPFASVHFISDGSDASPEALMKRYEQVLADYPPDVVFMGIGENGHIAFNDPPTADFFDPLSIKKVRLDETCRLQQVHDGCFENLDAVPKYALTLTVPALMRARYAFVVVPAATKKNAVNRAVREDISTRCPATILRARPNAVLYADPDSGADLL